MKYRYVVVALVIVFSILGGFQGCGKSDQTGTPGIGGPVPIGGPLVPGAIPGVGIGGAPAGCVPVAQNTPNGMEFDLVSQAGGGAQPQLQGLNGTAVVIAPGYTQTGNLYTRSNGSDTLFVYVHPDGSFGVHARLGITTIGAIQSVGAACIDSFYFNNVGITAQNQLFGLIYILSQGRTITYTNGQPILL